MTTTPTFDIVVPTVGRPSLHTLLAALGDARGPRPGRVVVVDDRKHRDPPLLYDAPPLDLAIEVRQGRAKGPAAARNTGWADCTAEWVAFVDDDVVPDGDWLRRLSEDLAVVDPHVAGVQGRLRVPLPVHRRPTDWERNVAGLAAARWATADMAYRRRVLVEAGGFDERFPRAFREDADLGLRVVDAGYRIVAGNRTASHPVRPADRWVSVRLQAGNVDDALMGALHGRHWHRRAAAPVGRIGMHVATTVAGAVGISAAVARRPRFGAIGAAAWLAGVGQFAWSRIRPGPRTLSEVTTMLATSVVIPPLATYHRATGEIRARVLRRSGAHALPRPAPPPAAVLFDRDGTLVVDVPYNGDPDLVKPQPGARAALDRLRAAGIPVAVVSNQSGVARGILTADEVHEVNRRVEQLLGPLGPFMVCMHGPADGCGCRKPAGGLIVRAADALGVDAAHCAVIGDIGADMEAARVAGARGILVPTDATRREEARAATEVATDIGEAVDLLIGRRVGP